MAQHKGTTYVDDLTVRDGQLLTSPTRTALDIASSHDVESGVVAVGSLLHAGETTPEALARRAAAMDQWPDSLLVRRVLRLADARPESVAEHRFVFWCARFGLPAPVPQMPVAVNGRTYRLDFAWPELKVWVEVDGRAKYDRWLRPGESPSDAVVREKRREDAIREATGWICIRVTWADLADPTRLERRLRRALRSGGLTGLVRRSRCWCPEDSAHQHGFTGQPVKSAMATSVVAGLSSARSKDAWISASASTRPTQLAPSTDLPGSRSL